MKIGDRIKKRRNELEMTLEDVSTLVGVTRQTIQKYESGIVSNIPSDKVELLASALRTTPAYLMGWAPEDYGSKVYFPGGPSEEKPAAQEGDEHSNPDIRMIARAGRKMTPEQAENLRKYAQYMFPEAFKDDDT